MSSGCFGGNIISLRWENFFPSFFANTFDNKGNSCCQILLIAVWIKARLLRENKKWIQTDLSSISWHSDRSMAPTCTRLKRLFQKKNSMTNTTDTWRWHVCDKNSAKLIFTFHFSKKKCFTTWVNELCDLCVYTWRCHLDERCWWPHFKVEKTIYISCQHIQQHVMYTCVQTLRDFFPPKLWSCHKSRYLRNDFGNKSFNIFFGYCKSKKV